MKAGHFFSLTKNPGPKKMKVRVRRFFADPKSWTRENEGEAFFLLTKNVGQ